MNRTERNLWKNTKRLFPGIAARMENAAHTGFPDVHGIFEGRDYWVELKVVGSKKPVFTNEKILKLMEESQVVWALLRIKYHKYKRLYILIGYNGGLRLFKVTIVNGLFIFDTVCSDKELFSAQFKEELCR